MEDYIAPLVLFIILFVGFGLSQRGKNSSGGCGSCSGGSCSGKSECSKEDEPAH